MVRVGFIGIGVMGRHMCAHLMDGGHTATVFSRTAAKCAPLVERGAALASSPRELAAASDVVFSIVSAPEDVRAVVLDAERGVLAGLAPGGLIIEMTTSTPSLAIEIARACEVRGSAALDAPVSGGDVGAKAATLSIMVGGDAHAFERATPLLALLGKSISRMGGPGAGQHTKLCNQILACSNMVGVCESLLYAQRAGLDAAAVAQAIGAGAAGSWAMTNLGDKVVQRDVRPGFMIAHMVKDLRIALDEARALGLQLPGLANAERLYAQLLAQGHGRDGTQALVLALEALVAEDAAQRK